MISINESEFPSTGKRYNKEVRDEVKIYIDDVLKLAAKNNIHIWDILRDGVRHSRCIDGNVTKHYIRHYRKRIEIDKETRETKPLSDKDCEDMIKDSLLRFILYPFDRINFYEDIIHYGKDQSGFELLSLMNLLASAINNNEKINISTTIKGIPENASITNKKAIRYLYDSAHRTLISLHGRKYERKFREFEKGLTTYSDKQLSKIYNYEVELRKFGVPSRNEFLKGEIQFCVERLKFCGLFSKDTKTVKTNEACFLYDILILLGIINSDGIESSQEKYVYIKNKLNGKDCTEYHYLFDMGDPYLLGSLW